MIIKCRKCDKEFEKASHRNQHEKDAHKPQDCKSWPKCGCIVRGNAKRDCQGILASI